jgi:hypothetical protein
MIVRTRRRRRISWIGRHHIDRAVVAIDRPEAANVVDVDNAKVVLAMNVVVGVKSYAK